MDTIATTAQIVKDLERRVTDLEARVSECESALRTADTLIELLQQDLTAIHEQWS